MRLRRRAAGIAVVAVIIASALTGCSSNESTNGSATSATTGSRVTVAMVTHGQLTDPFWVLVRRGAEQAATDFNVSLKYTSPKVTDVQAQAALIREAAAGKPQAFVVTIPDAAVLSAPVRQVSSSGVPVMAVNVGVDVYRRLGALTFVGQAEQTAGIEAGKQMAAARARRALCVIHERNNKALTDRCGGFRTQLAKSGGSVQVLQVNPSPLSSAQRAIQQALQQNRSIDAVLTTGIVGFTAAGGALKALNKLGTVKLGTFDLSNAALTAIQNGQALFAIDQQPFLEGYMGVQLAAAQVRYGQHPFQPIYTGPSLVTKANAAKVAQLYKTKGIPLTPRGYP